MNTTALKKFAPAVRNQLLAAIALKLDFVLSARTPDYLTTYAPQVAALRTLAQVDRAGLIERVAYTWFNRLAALRFMDARGWHPFRARVLTPAPGDTQPELLKVTRTGALPEDLRRHTKPERLSDLLDGRVPSSNAQGEVYRHLVLAACRYYNALLPDIFARLDDETELLLPDDLLTEHSVVQGFRTEISDADCGDAHRANVEILGWLYQFYISERKDQVMARKSAVPTADIPAVTQLFTPHWIVRYLVENSLGRLWLLNRPGSKLREHMPYYIEGEAESDFLKITKPEDIRVCDPAVGSGHMLTCAFDLLTLIYEEEGYAPTEIPALILRHNLHGLEICPRAAQLAELALVFKAREKSRRFFQPEYFVRPDIIELRDVRFAENELGDYTRAVGLSSTFNQPMVALLHQFEEAKNFGSLIQPSLGERAIATARCAIEAKDLGGKLFLRETHLKVLRVLEQAEALTQRYHVVVANPPYMGSKAMSGGLKQFAKEHYPDSKSDLFSMFMERGFSLAVPHGNVGMITMQSWMFLSSFEEIRTRIVLTKTILSMAHLGAQAFDTIAGAIVQSTAFIVENAPSSSKTSHFLRLIDGRNEAEKSAQYLDAIANSSSERCFLARADEFKKLPGTPIAYWISPALTRAFEDFEALEDLADARIGMATGKNAIYVRQWHEVTTRRIGFQLPSRPLAKESGKKWFPYAKGGEFRKWYGNSDCVVDWSNDGYALQTTLHPEGERIWAHNFNLDQVFRPAICWTVVTNTETGFRYHPDGYVFDAAAGLCQPKKADDNLFLLGALNSKVAANALKLINPTVNLHPGYLGRIPIPNGDKRRIGEIVDDCLEIAKKDWDNFETSWDFCDLPLLRPGLKATTLEGSWRNWEAQSTAAIHRMQELETENNRLFIAAYGLEGELQPEVPEAQITLARADARKDVAAFLSYAVGCMMGRYSLDHSGLILANAGDTLQEYLAKVGRPQDQLTFVPDADGIIPVLDGEWFDDDIVARTRDFLRATFGEATLRANLRFIEESLGKDLRKYFLTDFYKDHLQTYKKRPIYWMVQSPKKGFSVLVYLHRYTRDTMNLVLNRYLREYHVKLSSRLQRLMQAQVSAATPSAKTEARKEAEKLTKTLLECQEWERHTLLPLAQARMEIDLDDGVKVNYLKLGEALAPIPGLAAAEE